MNEQERKQLIDEKRKNINPELIKQCKIQSDECRYEYALNEKRKSLTLQEKWKMEGQQIYEENKSYFDCKQSNIDLNKFIDKVKNQQ
ncbi:hypothetical protein QI218_01775 [Staphylococcus saprophyticus]|nr:hypothetical protein [Staphylococcus saprophyticus]